jgi:hypothetical protein
MLSENEIENWKRKYPFLEGIINDCYNLFGIIEENSQRNEGLNTCRTRGYDSTQGESTSWEWYGVKNGVAKMLESGSLRDAMLRESFDYVVTHEHITTDIFEDDTIRIYKLKEVI